MTSAALTASKYELATRCLGAFTLPWRDESNTFSDAGTVRHAADEAAIWAGEIPDAYAERWPGFTWRAEVAFGLDIATLAGRIRGYGLGRDYGPPLTPFERFGTADALGWLASERHLVIADKKSFDEVTPAARNPQLRFLARAAASVLKPARVEVAISHELFGLDVAEIDGFEIDAVIPDELRQIEANVARARSDAGSGQPVEFTTGRWCRWCPAFNSGCPKQQALVELVRRDDEDPELAMATTVVGEDDAPVVFALWKRIGILHKRIGQSLHAMAASRPIPIGNGRMFGRHEKLGNEQLDGDIAYQVVRDLHGQTVADAAVSREASKAGIKRALKSAGLKVAPAEKAILAEVARRGGSSRKKTTAIEEFTPELQLVSGSENETDTPPEVAEAPF